MFGNALRFDARAVAAQDGSLIATGTHDRALIGT